MLQGRIDEILDEGKSTKHKKKGKSSKTGLKSIATKVQGHTK